MVVTVQFSSRAARQSRIIQIAYMSDSLRKQSRRLSKTLLPLVVPLLRDRKLGTLALGQRYPWLGALTDNEDVCHPAMRGL